MKTLTKQSIILVVDDNPTNLEILDHALNQEGYKVRIEAEGLNVMKQARLSIPDLILLDIMLPDINGFEVCQQLKADPLTKSIPIIFMTALADTVDKIKGLNLGAVDYITKPFQKQELLARVRGHLQLRELTKTLEIQNQQLIELKSELENRVAERTAELSQALEKEKEVNQLKSRFITMASHEFRTPLAIISSSSGILQNFSDRLSEKRKQEHLETIQNTIRHIIQILDDVLMINQAEAEKIEVNLEPLDIIKFCRHLKEQIEASFTSHGIDFYIDLGDEIFSNYQIVQVDKKLLRQIITNLLTNAIKYSPNHNLVNFSLSKKDDQLIFKISDHGIGIPEADQVHLFEYFQRGSNVGTLPGTGLGLSIVKKCVDLHQGEITFYSELGKGTVFTVILPFLKG
ncbi:hybrid sensor histidine kinase/response regulator [Anabaena sp. FACHB-1250]|uniref:histidine kinase n=1 Tax=Dolichospermum planctonicum TaxID=136072 RepID=A0A480ABY9_9CYAN|nr:MULTISPECIES: hybrid sensor histidine kinase/response regulator [Nostocales]MBD2141838.1 hybrid sensor histidine kinase/response regulator [Anabaena sp. FACHB-1250]MBD2268010.1 hybrid sensor histidine kinase/response regulator [Anabaena sp. FACHB-1391]GCL42477.1 response regulator receiver sensor signal transduction histidine kinase [Dolichospermum planctonicum]